MSSWTVPVLRVTIAGLFAAVLVSQVVLVPLAGTGVAGAYPHSAGFAMPLILVAELVLVCVEVALVCTWVLLTMVERELIFAGRAALTWVDRIVGAALVATVSSGGAAWWSVDLRPDLPALSAAIGAVALFGFGLTLLVVVMRGLLRQAAALRTELSEVV